MKKDIPVMTEEWVSLVWEKGKEENVHATDSQFSKHKCPALMGITFTVSQVPSVLLLYNLWDLTSLPAQDVVGVGLVGVVGMVWLVGGDLGGLGG